jgi:hypothetical protein
LQFCKTFFLKIILSHLVSHAELDSATLLLNTLWDSESFQNDTHEDSESSSEWRGFKIKILNLTAGHAELDSASPLLFSLSWNKETKFKAVSNHAKNIRFSSWRFELAALKHQIVFAPASAFDAPLFFTHDLIRPL